MFWLLIKFDCSNIHIENNKGETPLHLCCYSNNTINGYCGMNYMIQLEKDRKNDCR